VGRQRLTVHPKEGTDEHSAFGAGGYVLTPAATTIESDGPRMILAISGSLRRRSLNSAALRAAARTTTPGGIHVAIDASMRTLPHFDPDLEVEPPNVVRRFREACEGADAVLLAVPEYAFGIPGAFKNALDWTVGSGALSRKPIAVLSVAPPGRGENVRQALECVFTALDCDVSYHSVPIRPAGLSEDGEICDRRIARQLLRVVESLAGRARARSDGAESPLSASRHT
jgi:chromate reductase